VIEFDRLLDTTVTLNENVTAAARRYFRKESQIVVSSAEGDRLASRHGDLQNRLL